MKPDYEFIVAVLCAVFMAVVFVVASVVVGGAPR